MSVSEAPARDVSWREDLAVVYADCRVRLGWLLDDEDGDEEFI